MLFGIDKVVKYHMDAPLFTTTFVWAMNQARYESLSPAQRKVIDHHCTPEWAEKVATPWADFEHGGHAKLAAEPGHRGLHADAGSDRGVAHGGGAADRAMGGEGRERPTRCWRI